MATMTKYVDTIGDDAIRRAVQVVYDHHGWITPTLMATRTGWHHTYCNSILLAAAKRGKLAKAARGIYVPVEDAHIYEDNNSAAS